MCTILEKRLKQPPQLRLRCFTLYQALPQRVQQVGEIYEQNPVTKLGEQLLRDELQHLKHVERPAVITAISEARAQGAFCQKTDMMRPKKRQGFVEGRIIELEAKLANAQVIDPATLDAEGRVVFGATVLLEDLENSNEVRYQIVGDDEADIKVSKISISSPIARALIGKSAGDVAQVHAPSGVREYEIVEVVVLPMNIWLKTFFAKNRPDVLGDCHVDDGLCVCTRDVCEI